VFDYDPASTSQPCLGEPKCVIHSYASPYTVFVDLGVSQVSSLVWDLSVLDDTTFFGSPMDVVILGAKVGGIGYELYLIGPPDSFTGVGNPAAVSAGELLDARRGRVLGD